MRALRKYLVGELSGSRCSDSVAEIPIVDAFNAMVRRKEVAADVAAPIAASETRPARILGAAPADRYWETPGRAAAGRRTGRPARATPKTRRPRPRRQADLGLADAGAAMAAGARTVERHA